MAQASAAQGKAQIAEAAVRVAQARLADLQAGPTAQEITVARQRVCQAQAQEDLLRIKADKSALHSPVEGVVLDQVVRAGEVVAPAATILTVAKLDPVKLTVYVSVSHVGHIRVGQQVRATVDGFPGRTFVGYVTHVGDQPEYTPRNIATQEERLNTFYAVSIDLDNHDHVLKPGMPADVVFESPVTPGAQND
jgi:multidrug resistance efflux pump